MQDNYIIGYIIIIGVIGLLIWANRIWQLRKSQRLLQLKSTELGLNYSKSLTRDARDICSIMFVDTMEYPFDYRHHITGEWDSFSIQSAEASYWKHTGKHSTEDFYNFYLCKLPTDFPKLHIYPSGYEDIFRKLKNKFNDVEDINLDSVEFSNAFVIHSSDKKFAYDFCNPQMMEYLLEYPHLNVTVQGDTLMLIFNGRMLPEFIKTALDHLTSVRVLMPEFLFDTR